MGLSGRKVKNLPVPKHAAVINGMGNGYPLEMRASTALAQRTYLLRIVAIYQDLEQTVGHLITSKARRYEDWRERDFKM